MGMQAFLRGRTLPSNSLIMCRYTSNQINCTSTKPLKMGQNDGQGGKHCFDSLMSFSALFKRV